MKLFHRNCRTELLPIVPILFVLLLLTALVSPVAATPVTWYLSGVTFADGSEQPDGLRMSRQILASPLERQAQGTDFGRISLSSVRRPVNVSFGPGGFGTSRNSARVGVHSISTTRHMKVCSASLYPVNLPRIFCLQTRYRSVNGGSFQL